MRRSSAILTSLAATAALAGCGGGDEPNKSPDDKVAACKAAMKSDYAKALATPDVPSASRPPACEGVDHATLERLVGEVMTEVTPSVPN